MIRKIITSIRSLRRDRSRINTQLRLEVEQLEGRRLMAVGMGVDGIVNAFGVSAHHSNIRSSSSSFGLAHVTNAQVLSAAAVDDAFEDNDTWAKAADLGTISQSKTITNLVMADTADW